MRRSSLQTLVFVTPLLLSAAIEEEFGTGLSVLCTLKPVPTLVQALRLCTGRTARKGSRGIALLRLCTGRTAHKGSRGIALLRLCTGRTAHKGSRGMDLHFHDQWH